MTGLGSLAQQRKHRGQVATYDALAVPMGNHDAAGMAQAQGANLTGFSEECGGDGLGAFDHPTHAKEGIFEAVSPVHPLFNKMGDHFGVGLGRKFVSVSQQTLLQRKEVFDDAIMDHGDALVAVGVWMGVRVSGPAMGRPTGVPQAQPALRHVFLAGRREAVNFPHGLSELELARMIDYGDAGAVIAAVFQPLQSLKNDRPGFAVPHVTNYAAHFPSQSTRHRLGRRNQWPNPECPWSTSQLPGQRQVCSGIFYQKCARSLHAGFQLFEKCSQVVGYFLGGDIVHALRQIP